MQLSGLYQKVHGWNVVNEQQSFKGDTRLDMIPWMDDWTFFPGDVRKSEILLLNLFSFHFPKMFFPRDVRKSEILLLNLFSFHFPKFHEQINYFLSDPLSIFNGLRRNIDFVGGRAPTRSTIIERRVRLEIDCLRNPDRNERIVAIEIERWAAGNVGKDSRDAMTIIITMTSQMANEILRHIVALLYVSTNITSTRYQLSLYV
mgnify:CR=1 FL=1